MRDNERGWIEFLDVCVLGEYCTSDIVKKLAVDVADRGKEMLERLGKIRTTAYVLSDARCDVLEVRFSDKCPAEKQQAYKDLGAWGSERAAHSVLVLQDAKLHSYSGDVTEALLTLVISKRLRDFAYVHRYFRHKPEGGKKELLYFMDRTTEGANFVSSLGEWWG